MLIDNRYYLQLEKMLEVLLFYVNQIKNLGRTFRQF